MVDDRGLQRQINDPYYRRAKFEVLVKEGAMFPKGDPDVPSFQVLAPNASRFHEKPLIKIIPGIQSTLF